MKKICILQNGLASGGTDTFVVNLCKGLDKNRFDVTVVNPSLKPGSLLREPEVIAAGARIERTHPLNGIRGKARHLLRLYKLLRRERFDVFQTNIDLFNGPNLMVAWLAGVPLRCCHSHNGNQQKQIVSGRTLAIRAYQGMMRWMCRVFSNRRCGCSAEAMDFLYKNIDWRSSQYPAIIFNGIDLEKYSAPVDRDAKRKELSLTASKHLVTVGRIIPQKNPLFLARIFIDFCKTNDDCDLIWVGDGDLKPEVLKLFREAGIAQRVHFFFNRGDVNEILKCGDAFLLPSNFEGLGIVTIEAQAAGLRCLISDHVPHEADCGLCRFLPIDRGTAPWVGAINEALENKGNGEANPESLNKFSIKHMAEQMSEVFES